MYYDVLKLSVGNVIVSQKRSVGERKKHFFGRDSKCMCKRQRKKVLEPKYFLLALKNVAI